MHTQKSKHILSLKSAIRAPQLDERGGATSLYKIVRGVIHNRWLISVFASMLTSFLCH